MARRFTKTASTFLGAGLNTYSAAAAAVSAAKPTMVVRVKFSSFSTGAANENRISSLIIDGIKAWFILNIDATTTPRLRVGGRSRSADNFKSVTGATTALTADVWYTLAGTLDLTNGRIKGWINGVAEFDGVATLGSATILDDGTSTVQDTISDQQATDSPLILGGDVAEWALYKDELSAEEHAAIHAGMSMLSVRPDLLIDHVELRGEDGDVRSSLQGVTFTETGTVAVAESPVIVHPAWLSVVRTAAAGGAAVDGAATLILTPTATLDFERHASIGGAVELLLTPAATMDYTSAQAIAGDATLLLTPAAAMDFERHASMAGGATLLLTPAAALDFTRHAAIAGSADLILTAAATMGFLSGNAINGAATLLFTPAGVMDFTRHAAIAGAVELLLTAAASMDFTQIASIAGDVSLVLTPEGTMLYTAQSASIAGTVTLLLEAAATLDYTQHAAIAGDVTLILEAAASMEFTNALISTQGKRVIRVLADDRVLTIH